MINANTAMWGFMWLTNAHSNNDPLILLLTNAEPWSRPKHKNNKQTVFISKNASVLFFFTLNEINVKLKVHDCYKQSFEWTWVL